MEQRRGRKRCRTPVSEAYYDFFEPLTSRLFNACRVMPRSLEATPWFSLDRFNASDTRYSSASFRVGNRPGMDSAGSPPSITVAEDPRELRMEPIASLKLSRERTRAQRRGP